MIRITHRTGQILGLALIVGLATACGTDITEPAPGESPALNAAPQGIVRLAKQGPEGSSATFHISATGGQLTVGSTVTLDACNDEVSSCSAVTVWQATSDDIEEITITEVSFTGDLVLERIRVNSDLDGGYNILMPDPPTVTVRASSVHDAAVRFKNVGTPPDDEEEGIAGCTPGFWKQAHHFEFWTAPYSPDTQFSAVFANAFPGMTLLDVVGQGGGGLEALGRHVVAALLNAASADVQYGLDPASVIATFNAAYASGSYEMQKDMFEEANERGCTAKD